MNQKKTRGFTPRFFFVVRSGLPHANQQRQVGFTPRKPTTSGRVYPSQTNNVRSGLPHANQQRQVEIPPPIRTSSSSLSQPSAAPGFHSPEHTPSYTPTKHPSHPSRTAPCHWPASNPTDTSGPCSRK